MSLFDFFRTEDPDNGNDSTDNQPCNVSGHDWPEWSDGPFGPRTKSAGLGPSNKLRVYTKQSRNCRKCDKYDHRRRTIGHIRVDAEEDTIEVVD